MKKAESLSEWQIRSIHQLILQKIDDSNAGRYRDQNVVISGARHSPPDFLQVPGEMQRFMEWYEKEGPGYHPVERAALVHSFFVKIHPFVDGNGRTARLLMNFELMKDGYVPVVIRKEDRLAYYEVLDKSHADGDHEDVVRLVAEGEERMLDLWLRVLHR